MADVHNSSSSSRLFAPLAVGPFTLRHRVVHATLGQARAISGAESRLAPLYHGPRTTAGGLVISQATGIASESRAWPYAAVLDRAEEVQALKAAIDTVHAHGGIWFQQLFHVGRSTSPALVRLAREAAGLGEPAYGWRSVSASAVAEPGFNTHSAEAYGEPHALTAEEIDAIVGQFRAAAQKAQDAGADGVEILAGNGYLLDQFLHDNINQRTDAYGGSVENRARFALEVVDAVAAVFGHQRVGVRISPFSDLHGTDGSQPLVQLLHLAQELAKRGVAYVHVRSPRAQGQQRSLEDNVQRLLAKVLSKSDISLGPFRRLLRETRPTNPAEHTTPTVLLTSGGYAAETALAAVDSDEADAVAFGREFVANPDLVDRVRRRLPFSAYDPETLYAHGPLGYITYPKYGEKAAADAPSETGANGTSTNGRHVNGSTPNGTETKKPRRVAIVGAGVSGLLSVYALQRLGGFDLQVYEQKDKPGGAWAFDAVSRNRPQFVQPELDVSNAPVPPPKGALPQTTTARVRQPRFVSSPLYPHLQANVPYRVMAGGTSIAFPEPKPGNSYFLRGRQITQALYAAAKPVQHLIRFNTTLERVDKLPEDRLRLVLRTENDDGTDTWFEDIVDHLIVAAGHNTVPVVPKVPGIETWPGGLQHSTTWRQGRELAGQRVLLVGTSTSGTDIALQSLPHVQKPLLVAQRTPNPRHPDVFARDGIQIVAPIARFEGGVIHLADGTTLHHRANVDTVIFATGYAYTYPFFPASVRPPAVDGVRVPGLYQHVFDRHNPRTIGFVGLIQNELTWLAWEKTAFVLGLLWRGDIQLPPAEAMAQWEAVREAATASNRAFHVMLPDPYARVLYYEALNALARDYLEDPRTRDDTLLRSFRYEWAEDLQTAIEEKDRFYKTPYAWESEEET